MIYVKILEIKEAALNYWNGTPHYNESLWKYLTPKATITKVHLYDDYEEEIQVSVSKSKSKMKK